MSIDKRTRAAGQALLRQAERLSAPDLSQVESRRRTYRFAASFAGAAIGLIAAIGAVGLVRNPSPGDSVTPPSSTSTTIVEPTTTTTTTPPATSTTVPAPGGIVGADGWSLLPPLEGGATYSDYPIKAVTAGRDRLVAVGVACVRRRADGRIVCAGHFGSDDPIGTGRSHKNYINLHTFRLKVNRTTMMF